MTASYLGEHKFYGNAYAAVRDWNRAGASIKITKGDKNADIKFIDFDGALKPEEGLLYGTFAQAIIPEAWQNSKDRKHGVYIDAAPEVRSPKHISIFINKALIAKRKLSDSNLSALLAHELGHALGLGHSERCAGNSPSLMRQSVLFEPKSALPRLQAFDIAEFRKWYNLR